MFDFDKYLVNAVLKQSGIFFNVLNSKFLLIDRLPGRHAGPYFKRAVRDLSFSLTLFYSLLHLKLYKKPVHQYYFFKKDHMCV